MMRSPTGPREGFWQAARPSPGIRRVSDVDPVPWRGVTAPDPSVVIRANRDFPECSPLSGPGADE